MREPTFAHAARRNDRLGRARVGDGRGPLLGLDSALHQRREAVERRRVERGPARAAVASSGTESTASARLSQRVADLGGRDALGEQLAGALVARAAGDDGGDERAGSGQAGERLRPAATGPGERVDLGEHLARRGAGDVRRPPATRPAAASAATFLAAPASSTPVTSLLVDHVELGGGEGVGQLPGKAPVERRRRPPRRPASSISAALAGPPSTATARALQRSADKRRGQRAQRRHQTLGDDEHAGAAGDPPAVGGDHRRAAPGPGTARQTMSWPSGLSSEARSTRTAAGSGHSGQVARRSLALTAASGPARRVRQPRSTSKPARARQTARLVPQAPAPMIATRRTGGQAAEPLPLQHHARPDPVRDRAGQRGRGSATCGKRSARPARMRTLWGRIRQPLRTASVPITATGTTGAPVSSARRPTPRLGLPSASGTGPRALREDQHDVATARGSPWRS